MDNVEVELGAVKRLCSFSISCERLFDFLSLTEVEKANATSLLARLGLVFIMLKYLCRQYTEGEVWLTLDGPLHLLSFVFLLIVLLHLSHLVSDELVILFWLRGGHVV